MESTFIVSKTDCMSCNNQVLKTLGTLQGIFGAEMDRIDGKIVVSHTDEVTRGEIGNILASLGFLERVEEIEVSQPTEPLTDEPSIWGCSL